MSPPSSPSDTDDDLTEDMEALRRACILRSSSPDTVDTDSDTESGGKNTDIDLLRRLKDRFSHPSAASTSAAPPPMIMPFSARGMYNSDGEDDVETLRAIQRRFDRYKSNKAGMVVAEVVPPKETLHNLSEPAKSMTHNEEFRESDTTELHDAEDGTHNIPVKAFMYSQFPKSAQNFIDVLKKNRSCQKFMRRKLIEIEAKIEENKELRERIKCLMDFQVACERKTGRMLCQEKDPRIKLISSRKSSTGKIPKCRWRNTLHPDRKKVGRWSVDEDKRLKVAVMLFGARSWNKIAQFAPGRTQVQCRERWLNCLDPSLNLEPWTEEEDAKLLSALEEHGYSWSKVAMCVPPRTDNQCRRRWKTLVPKEVPVLQAVKKMKRAVLISNFVDRESERPLIGPGDFLAVLPHTAEDGNNNTVEKKTPRKSRAKFKRSIEKKVKADGTLNSSADTVPSDSYLIVGLSSTGAESGSLKRSGKEPSSDNLPNKSRDRRDNFLEQKLEADPMTNLYSKVSVDHSSPLPCSNSVTNASASMKRTLKRTSSCELPKMSRVKQGSSLEGNITEDGTTKPSTEVAVAALSYVPCVDTGSVERGSNKDNRENIKESWSC